MNTRMIKTIAAAASISMMIVAQTMAGGTVPFQFDNAADAQADSAAYFYDSNQTTVVPSNSMVQVIALTPAVTPTAFNETVLWTTAIGSSAGPLSGDQLSGDITTWAGVFDTGTVNIGPSNVLEAVKGDVMAVRFFDVANPSPSVSFEWGIVSNATILSPTPDWPAPPFPSLFEIDTTVAAFQGAAADGALGPGFYADQVFTAPVPEPSSIALVVLGMLGGFGLIRRRR